MKNIKCIFFFIVALFISTTVVFAQGENIVKVCDWKDCKAGAASVSVDDSYTSCRDLLNSLGLKGTFYLMDTKDFTTSTWNVWKSIYNEGHEIGAHTQNHPCSSVSNATLRYELSSNKNDIITKLNISANEVTSFAWPCGFNTPQEEAIASEYFLSSRGYFINQLEEKNPADFMNIKSLNTPHYHNPPLEPPDYFMMADLAETQGKWVNYVFHNECSDDGAITYLTTKNLWTAPVGKVAKYIFERQYSVIQNFQNTSSFIKFNLVNNLNHSLYNQELTLKVLIGNNTAKVLKVNNISKTFTNFNENNTKYIEFNALPTGNDIIEITLDSQSQLQLYLAPYVGDIDGSINPDWFFFYNQLKQWHNDNNISVGMSFYSNTMNNAQFNQIIGNMYASENIELITKSESEYNGTRIDLMSYSQVKETVAGLQNKFIAEMEKLGYTNVKAPVAWNQNQGRFTETIRNAIHDIGFKIYFEQYVSEYGNIDPLPDFDVMQYSVSFTTDGQAGPKTVYKSPEQIEQEILNFQNDHMVYINGIKVVETYASQQDFAISDNSPVVNQNKWNTYTTVLQWAKNDPRIKLLTPEMIYDLRHPVIPNSTTTTTTSTTTTTTSITTTTLPSTNYDFTDFEASNGWTAAGTSQGKFEIGVPVLFNTTTGQCKTTCFGTGPGSDHTPTGVNAACTNLDGYMVQFETVSTNSLTSPVYDFTGKTNVNLGLWRFMEIEGTNYDFCYYQYKNSSSGSWTIFETYGTARIDDSSWQSYSRNISSYADNKAYFQLRFYCTTDDWTEGSGLCLDDIDISWTGGTPTTTTTTTVSTTTTTTTTVPTTTTSTTTTSSITTTTTTTTTTIPTTTTTTTTTTTSTTSTTLPATKCWDAGNKYITNVANQFKKFCKCAQGTYGYQDYTSI
ncbi:MAG: polysaccharide deacetylase family protein, partial [Candidatus Aenigmarchaeota archaeon]|nr:polysaccharide deacetylase family protein [Candidatus Aenigmarchaeota archaeon]